MTRRRGIIIVVCTGYVYVYKAVILSDKYKQNTTNRPKRPKPIQHHGAIGTSPLANRAICFVKYNYNNRTVSDTFHAQKEAKIRKKKRVN